MNWTLYSTEKWPTPSHALLLRAALLEGDEARAAWEAWLAANSIEEHDAGTFYLFPRLYTNLNRLGVCGPAVDKLRGVYRFTWAKNQTLLRGVTTLLNLFHRAGIPTIVLKGAPLLWFYYKDTGERMMHDVDVLIAEGDLSRAATAMQTSGWRFTEPLPDEYFAPFVHAVPCAHPSFAQIDLHWRPLMVDSPPDAECDFRNRAVPHVVHGVNVRTPDATDLLLLVLVHSRKPEDHSVCRWVADAVTVVRAAHPAIDWEALLERARALGVLLPVRDALTYVHNTFVGIVPPSFLERVHGTEVTADDRRRYHQLMHESQMNRGIADLLVTHWWRYSTGCRAHGRYRTPVGFARYFWIHHERVWGLPSRWHVASRIVSELAAYTRRAHQARALTARTRAGTAVQGAPVLPAREMRL